MKKVFLIISAIAISNVCHSQEYMKVLEKLGIQSSSYLPENDKIVAKESMLDGSKYFTYETILKKNVFNELGISYDSEKNIYTLSLDAAKSKTYSDDFESIYNQIKSEFGEPIYQYKDFMEFTYLFEKNNEYIELKSYDYNSSEVRMFFNSYEIKTEKNDFDKSTKYSCDCRYPWVTTNFSDFYIFFTVIEIDGLRKLAMTIRTGGEDWKFIDSIDFLASDGEVFSSDLVYSRTVQPLGGVSEAASVIIPIEFAEKIQSAQDLRIRVKGEKSYEIPFINPMFKSFSTLRELVQ